MMLVAHLYFYRQEATWHICVEQISGASLTSSLTTRVFKQGVLLRGFLNKKKIASRISPIRNSEFFRDGA